MFTGIVADVGEIVKAEQREGDRRIWVHSELLGDCDTGASVAVDGVCLTVTDVDGSVCRFDVSVETIDRSTLGAKKPGDRVNLERPLRMGDELGGHIVQGHVDGVGMVLEVAPEGEGKRLVVSVGSATTRYLVEKGSVTVDGVSLTVTEAHGDSFAVALVPHTLAATTLGQAEIGRPVNIEIDVLAKYVERLGSSK